jgi:hypothetical protein
MTRTISLFTATVGAALLFAVPAMADNWGADLRSSSEVGYLNPDMSDRATAVRSQEQANMLNAREKALSVAVEGRVDPIEAHDRAMGTRLQTTLDSDFYADGFAQALQPREPESGPVVDDRFHIDHTNVPVQATPTSSGSEIEWPQIGVGFGIGLVLALGLYLAMRFTRIRPLAH